jgi:hypothetical protein
VIRVSAEGVYAAISSVSKTGIFVAPIAFAYIATTRPQLIASAGGWVAEQVGSNRFVGIFAVYLIGTLLVFQFLRPLWWCVRTVGKPISRLARLRKQQSRRVHPLWQARVAAAPTRSAGETKSCRARGEQHGGGNRCTVALT